MTGIKTTCAYCGVGCGVVAFPDGKGGADIDGDTSHPANFGKLCTKGKQLGETIDPNGRMLHPYIGGVKSTWDEATSLVAHKFKSTIEKYGPDSVAFYVSGQLLTEDYYVANKLMKGFIGSANIDTNSRLCMASSVAGHKRAFGTDTVPGNYNDLDDADVIVLVGSNLAWCHPILHQRILKEHRKRPKKIINIDPRRTASSELATLHLGIKSGGDVPLFLGLLNEIQRVNALDDDYLSKGVSGLHKALKNSSYFTVDNVARKTGLTNSEIEEFYQTWIGSEKVVTVYSQGVNQSIDGTDKVNAIINCHLATGRIGKPGMGPFSVTGQPNAMGGREVGGLANMLAAHLDIENSNHRRYVQDFWGSPAIASTQGLKAVDLFDACAMGKIKALWVMCTNPAVSMPDANNVRAAIKNVDFVVVSDILKDTDTTQLADVILPATGWGEKEGTVTNSERRISRQRAFIPPLGEARHDWKIICDVASKMGWPDAFDYSNPHQIYREYAKMTYLSVMSGKDLDLTHHSNITREDYNAMVPIQWPIQSNGTDTRFFADGQFFTETGKANMVPVAHKDSSIKPSKHYPLVLNTGRLRDHWHTMTRTGKSETLSQHIAEPFLEIHPEDAFQLQIETADLVEVESSKGTATLRALVSKRVQKGAVFAPIHWTAQYASNAVIDNVATNRTDPISGQPELKATPVYVTKTKVKWYGFAISVTEPDISTEYWAKARVANGWRMEIGVSSIPSDLEDFAKTTLGLKSCDISTYYDPTLKQQKIALFKDGKLQGLIFSSPTPVVASRTYLIGCLDKKVSPNILAGFAGDDIPDAGPIVCSCFSIGMNTIVDAVNLGKATSVADIGKCLKAGTNCGSCQSELASILARHQQKVAAE